MDPHSEPSQDKSIDKRYSSAPQAEPGDIDLSSHTMSGAQYQRGALTQALRDRTQRAHRSVEDGNDINRLLAGKVNPVREELVQNQSITQDEYAQRREEFLEVYKAALIASYGFEKALEEALDDSPLGKSVKEKLGMKEESPRASERIAKDLTILGAEIPKENAVVPTLSTEAEIVGALYVRLGSRKGGLIIAKSVNKSLGIDGESGLDFFGYLGRDTNKTFSTFLKGADTLVTEPSEIDSAVDGAIKLFEAVGKWQHKSYQEAIPDLYKKHSPSRLKKLGRNIRNFFVQE